jgi:hypothetical protein
MKMMPMTFPSCRSLVLLIPLTLSSCDKAENLRAQQAALQIKRAAVMEQIKAIDAQLSTLGPNGMASVGPMQKQAEEVQTGAVILENTAADALRKWGALEKAASALQTRADAWKAKHLK